MAAFNSAIEVTPPPGVRVFAVCVWKTLNLEQHYTARPTCAYMCGCDAYVVYMCVCVRVCVGAVYMLSQLMFTHPHAAAILCSSSSNLKYAHV